MKNISNSSFSLAKGKNLLSDDFSDIQSFDNLNIAIMCDGVGSAKEGRQAAQKTCQYLMDSFKSRPKAWSIEKCLKTFINNINNILYSSSMQDYQRVEMITTLAIVVIHGNRLYGANIGDTRIYLLRENILTQLSSDHVMNEKGYEDVLTLAVGMEEQSDLYYFENTLEKEDKILLCTDGLYKGLSEEELIKQLAFGAYSLVKKASAKVDDLLEDDCSALILNINKKDELAQLKSLNLKIASKLSVNDVIDDYTLVKSLIQDERTWICKKENVEYIIKFPPLNAEQNPQEFDTFIKEIWNAKRLEGDFFPKTYLPVNRTYRYYLMDKIEGKDLKEHLKNSVLSIEETIELTKVLLKMSQYLLNNDLVHADIKPENIMITQINNTKSFKIIDFGSITEIYSLQTNAGTPSYIAPERFHGAALNESTEIYSIGVTLYEALCNKYPYGEVEAFSSPSFNSLKRPKNFNKNIPVWFESFLLHCLCKDANNRYSSYSHVLFELKNPEKVIPYFDKNTPFLEKDPVKFYKIGFYTLLLINFIFLINIL
ncbi:MAG: protein phosphatase 2C domain-containing protein [Campylobacteraceae bacterium]|nr:protein phosphatase 2C domain-containing protein [Campylobacteraceae bacterium]